MSASSKKFRKVLNDLKRRPEDAAQDLGVSKKVINNILKKGNLILTGAYGFPVPINDKKIIEATSSAFGDAKVIFN